MVFIICYWKNRNSQTGFIKRTDFKSNENFQHLKISIEIYPFKFIRYNNSSTPTPTTSFVKLSGEKQSGTSLLIGVTSIDKDMAQIDRIFRQANGQGYKKENAEEISKFLTNLAATLFMPHILKI